MPEQYMKKYGPGLFEAGFEIIPIVPNKKNPSIENWREMEITEELVKEWVKKRPGHGVGIRGSSCPALDIDINHPEASKEMQAFIDDLIGRGPIRRGLGDKVLLPVECDIKRKQKSAIYDDGNGNLFAIELLTDGQQWVAHGFHEGAGRDYIWERGDLRTAAVLGDLPVLTADVLTQIFTKWNEVANRYGFKLQSRGQVNVQMERQIHPGNNKALVPSSGLALATVPQGLSEAERANVQIALSMTEEEIEELLDSTSLTSGGSARKLFMAALTLQMIKYQEWQPYLAIISYELPLSQCALGLAIANAISSQKPGYEGPGEVTTKFTSHKRDDFSPGGVQKAGTLFDEARKDFLDGNCDWDQVEAVIWSYVMLLSDKERRSCRQKVAEKLGISPEALDAAASKVRAENANSEFDRVMHEINAMTALVISGGQSVFPYTAEGSNDIQILTKETMVNLLEPWVVEPIVDGKPKRTPGFTAWLRWSGRRVYDGGFCFEPNGGAPNQFNLYQKNSIIPAPGDASATWSFFREVACAGDDVNYRHLRKMFAYFYQNPGGPKLGVALILLGKQGTGKGTLFRIISKLFEPHVAHIGDPRQFLGQFNGVLANSILTFVDEAVRPHDKSAVSALKALITEPTIMINEKYRPAYSVSNYNNLIIASNYAEVYPVAANDRRPFILEVSDCHMQDRSYFKELLEKALSPEALSALAWDLLQEDVSDMMETPVPRTRWMTEQYEFAATSEERFIMDLLHRGKHDPVYGGGWKDRVSRQGLFEDYRQWCVDEHIKHPLNNRAFGRRVCELLPVKNDVKTKENGKWLKAYQFPELSECRKHFCQAVNHQIEWEDIEEDDTSHEPRVTGFPSPYEGLSEDDRKLLAEMYEGLDVANPWK